MPNEGVIYYRWLFNEPRVMVTSPKALAEVLVQRNYDFVKPGRVREGIGRILGVGILLAEGDEHKVGGQEQSLRCQLLILHSARGEL